MSKRMSLILGDDEQVRIAPYIDVTTPQHQVLLEWAELNGMGLVRTEAAMLRALLLAGVDALRDDALDEGYAALARDLDHGEADSERRAARERHAARTTGT